MKLFDSHCHLQLSQFDEDRDAVLSRMRELQVSAIVVGTDYDTSKAAIELVSRGEALRDLWAAVGLHPNDNKEEHFDISKYEELAQNPKVVAIGECGLDYFRSGGTDEERAAQKERFEKQIGLAIEVQKALIIHCRNAHDDMLEILSRHSQECQSNNVSVVIHFFTGTAELAQKYLDLGCYLSFPGPVTYTDMYDDSIRVTPLERMLVETDSPFAAPVPFRGKRNEPSFVAEVVKKIASIKGISEDEVAAATLAAGMKICKV